MSLKPSCQHVHLSGLIQPSREDCRLTRWRSRGRRGSCLPREGERADDFCNLSTSQVYSLITIKPVAVVPRMKKIKIRQPSFQLTFQMASFVKEVTCLNAHYSVL